MDVNGNAIVTGSLVVTGSGNNLFLGTGKVGIATGPTTPTHTLQIGNNAAGSNFYAATIGLGVDDALHYIEGRNSSGTDDGIAFYTSAGGGAAASEKVRFDGSGNVGIGRKIPNATLDVSGSVLITGSLIISSSANSAYIGGGNVGIGTTAPNAKLDVNGNAIITGSLLIGSDSSSGSTTGTASFWGASNTNVLVIGNNSVAGYANRAWAFRPVTNPLNGSATDLQFYEYGLNGARVTFAGNGGNVGIGTTVPNAKLDVNGNTIITGSLIVSQSQINVPRTFTLESPATNDTYTWFYTPVAITATKLICVVQGAALPINVSASIFYGTTRNGLGTSLTSSVFIPVNYTGSGNIYTTFTNPNIAANSWVWFKITGSVIGSPTELSMTLLF